MEKAILLHSVLIFVFLSILLKGSDLFLEGAVAIAKRLSIHPYWIGITVVSVGTSLPELAASLAGIMKGTPAIMVGTVVGSNVLNLALVAGIGILIKPLRSWNRSQAIAMGSMVAASFALWAASFLSPIPHWIGLGMLACYILYLLALKGEPEALDTPEEEKPSITPLKLGIWVVGLAMVLVGSEQAVNHAMKLAKILNVHSGFIALIIISVGTSLPELGVTIASAIKGEGDIMLGNVVGSNVANILLISGISFLFANVTVSPLVRKIALPYMVFVAVSFMLMCRIKRSLSRLDGAILLITYAIFLILSFRYLTGG